MNRLGVELSRIDRFDDATRLVCEKTRALGIEGCRVVMQANDEAAVAAEVAFPVIGRQGWFATIVCGGATAAHQRELAMIAMHLSVWCTVRGIGGSNDALTPRQLEIAELAALGQTNAEIAAALGISINTVKARLKEVFERLGVCNRTELAHELLSRGSETHESVHNAARGRRSSSP
jgi:DNA-binding CsgD family transcriptional regulator